MLVQGLLSLLLLLILLIAVIRVAGVVHGGMDGGTRHG